MTSKQSIIMYSTSWCPDCHRAKHFLDYHGLAYINIDVEEDEAGLAVVKKLNGGQRIVPTLIFPDGTILVEPGNADLAAKLNLPEELDFYW